ncbi:MAG TPA: hypothetical protein VK674_06660 [Candidatus Limnocylindria bacterium]|nr:hypothetical protein [Candidatus Limnocylindria bacterium]
MRMRSTESHGGGQSAAVVNIQRPRRQMDEAGFVEEHGQTHWKPLLKRMITAPLLTTEWRGEAQTEHRDLVQDLKDIDVRTKENDAHWHPSEKLAIPKPVFKKASHGDTYTGARYHRRQMAVQAALAFGALAAAERPFDLIPQPVVSVSEGVLGLSGGIVDIVVPWEIGGGGGSDDGKIPVVGPTAANTGQGTETPLPSIVTSGEQPTGTPITQATGAAPEGFTVEYLDGSKIACPGEGTVTLGAGEGRGQAFGRANQQLGIDSEPEYQWVGQHPELFLGTYGNQPGDENQIRIDCQFVD